ncbi:hypothetical protein H4219_006137 [Mycoemilia scoparia]|uniref:Uncharacterized protein n=1 Tax=Mycoemilia scoparia TaxID=417184 RepID=A0A9W8DID1_9FUNG|nr:hypothetical protein H4219_006137 [Mycoemilia scoparia]
MIDWKIPGADATSQEKHDAAELAKEFLQKVRVGQAERKSRAVSSAKNPTTNAKNAGVECIKISDDIEWGEFEDEYEKQDIFEKLCDYTNHYHSTTPHRLSLTTFGVGSGFLPEPALDVFKFNSCYAESRRRGSSVKFSLSPIHEEPTTTAPLATTMITEKQQLYNCLRGAIGDQSVICQHVSRSDSFLPILKEFVLTEGVAMDCGNEGTSFSCDSSATTMAPSSLCPNGGSGGCENHKQPSKPKFVDDFSNAHEMFSAGNPIFEHYKDLDTYFDDDVGHYQADSDNPFAVDHHSGNEFAMAVSQALGLSTMTNTGNNLESSFCSDNSTATAMSATGGGGHRLKTPEEMRKAHHRKHTICIRPDPKKKNKILDLPSDWF